MGRPAYSLAPDALAEALRLHGQGRALRDIARELRARRLTGYRTISHSVIRRVLERAGLRQGGGYGQAA